MTKHVLSKETQAMAYDFALPLGRWSVGLTLMVADLMALGLAFIGGIALRSWLGASIPLQAYLSLWPLLGIFLLTFGVLGLYPGTGLTPPQEMRKTFWGLLLGFAMLAAATFLSKTGPKYSRGAFLLALMQALILVPLARFGARAFFSRFSWWGEGVLILGAGKTGERLVQALQKEQGMGLRPVALLDDDPQKQGRHVFGVPVMGPLALAPHYQEKGLRHVMVAMPGIPSHRLLEVLESHTRSFPRIVLIPNFFDSPSLWVQARDLGGILGLEVEQHLLHRPSWWLKRAIDLALLTVSFPLWAPLMVLGAVLVKLSSPGPVFFWQERLGLDGRTFRVCKFRTMYVDAEERLHELLARDPVLRTEYERYHKLRDDPRVPPIGRWLRKWSLDELPQIWNVLRGEMSLVGPRAYMPRELGDMEGLDFIILRVRPGITGLWQVSGRNQLSFAERLRLDVYYVRNWSIWLDLWILLKTVKVVLLGEGAY